MATKALIEQAKRTPKFKSRSLRRCFRCGRKRGYMRDFGLCRACFREMANNGFVPGIKKSSW
ncbi:MAG: type Z 30S ribosomal protein S14 [Candidatus Wildermuthbacteria bacterium]|nr:type Z 30S ribosomal protein S14 [Candidatus Wildermuthbacteria bacterium]